METNIEKREEMVYQKEHQSMVSVQDIFLFLFFVCVIEKTK